MDVPEIKLLLMDVDGVLTDGSILIDSNGVETKRFFVRDGSALVAWRRSGRLAGVITGRPSPVTTIRMNELGIDCVQQCDAMGKAEAYERIKTETGVGDDAIAYLGDDWADLPVLRRVAYPMAVADAGEEVRGAAHYVTQAPGGRGAVRDAIEHLLKSMNAWDDVLQAYVR